MSIVLTLKHKLKNVWQNIQINQFTLFMQTLDNHFAGILPIKTINCILFINFSEVIWVKAARKYSFVCIKGQQDPIHSVLSFSAMEEMLPASYFFKCHRSCIINLLHLKKLDKNNRRIHLSDDQCVTISEMLIKDFLHRTNADINKKN